MENGLSGEPAHLLKDKEAKTIQVFGTVIKWDSTIYMSVLKKEFS